MSALHKGYPAVIFAAWVLSSAQAPGAVAQTVVPGTNPPLVIFDHPYVPTDMAGPGGSLGHAQNLRMLLLGPDRNTLPNSHGVIVARDPRYSFTGQWLPINWGAAGVAVVPEVRTIAAVVPTDAAALPVVAPSLTARLDNLFYHDTDATRISAVPLVMPTAAAQFTATAGNEVALSGGALLIKSGAGSPVYVSSAINGTPLTVRLARNSLVMVSLLDNRLTVANFSDAAPDSVVVFLGDNTRCDYGSTPVRVGHIAEIYPNGAGCAENELVAYSIHTRVALSDGLTLESMRLSYPRALKRFNLTCVLTDSELRKVLKTAAAVSYVDREREWNGLETYVP